MTAPTVETIKRYYDERIDRKIWDFTSANPRIETALGSLLLWLPKNAANILEIGCGIGATSWRVARFCRQATILGVDVSSRSIEVARTCFRLANLSFRDMSLAKGGLSARFDCVVMMDVYEHIAAEQRPGLHEFLADALTENGRIFLSFPTPQNLKFLKEFHPDEIQPIDEDITVEVLERLSADVRGRLLFYREVSIWKTGDYAHAVVGRDKIMTALSNGQAQPWRSFSKLGLQNLWNRSALKLSGRQRNKIVQPWYRVGKS